MITQLIHMLLMMIALGSLSSCQREHTGGEEMQPQDSAARCEIEAVLADSSRLRGTLSAASVAVRANYAHITVDPHYIVEINFGADDTALVVMSNGDRIRGILDLDSITVATLVGRVALPRKVVRSIRFSSHSESGSGDMIAFYPFDGDAQDASGNGNHGSVADVAPVADRFGRPGSAVLFNGTTSAITVPSGATLHPRDQLSIAFWIRVDHLTNNYSAIIHKGGTATEGFDNRGYACFIKMGSPGRFQFQAFSAGDESEQTGILSDGDQPLREWLFVAVVFDRKNHVSRLYVNGSPVAEQEDRYSTFNMNNASMTIGVDNEGAFPDRSPFNGALDELRLYAKALTKDEIQVLYKR